MRIAFIERKYWRKNFLAFSLEKVFEQVARLLPAEKFETEIVKVPYGNSVFDIARNLLRFRRPKADIYHITGQIHYMALVLPPDRTVLTIHDLWAIDQSRSGWLKRTIIKKLLLDMPVRRLNYITAVSETTKRRIVEQSGCDPEKVRVIHDPVQDHFFRPEPKSFDRERPVILQVGITENKNIPRLLRALNGVACLLRIVGNMTPELESELIASGVEFENLLGLSDQEMRLAYRDADIVAFCSTYEGFGLPIVEAQAMERPILTSDLPPMNEISGGGAVLVDPFDVASIRAGLLRLIEDEPLRAELIRKGAENAKRFNAQLVADQYRQLYQEILRRKSSRNSK